MFVNTFWSLVPPIVAIGLALLTKETYSSLFIGIVVGALLATDFSPIGALDTIINDGLTAAIADNAGIFLFLVILGVMVALSLSIGLFGLNLRRPREDGKISRLEAGLWIVSFLAYLLVTVAQERA